MELPLTIQEAAAALRAGQITSVELTRTLLDKIEKLNPILGACRHGRGEDSGCLATLPIARTRGSPRAHEQPALSTEGENP